MADEARFYEIEPSSENYWRAIILFGRNVASYKFALAKSLHDLSATRSQADTDLIRLEELAPVFAGHISEHLKSCDKQITSSQSKFLDACRQFNRGEITQNELSDNTVRLGFANVIDAFHVVHGTDIARRFFIDERRSSGGIRLTEDFFRLAGNQAFSDLNLETEARWRLVETAWELNLSRHAVQVAHDETSSLLQVVTASSRRVNITSCRDALNGYQKGRCFYCFKSISVGVGTDDLADVDHFFPHKLHICATSKPINGVVNLVLACKECNRGAKGKFDRLPQLPLLERLYQRNEYLIKSHHPLRETLMLQSGVTDTARQNFLQDAYNCAKSSIGSADWLPTPCGDSAF